MTPNPHYRAILATKAQVSTAQITAQTRTDDTRVKGQIVARSYYDEAKAAIEAYKAEHSKDDSDDSSPWRAKSGPGLRRKDGSYHHPRG